MSSSTLLLQLRQIWADTQRPTRLQSDNGMEFEGEVGALCRKMGIRRSKGRPYRPQTQGCVERRNNMVKTKLKAGLRGKPGSQWPELLAEVQEQINSSPTRVLGDQAPTQVLFGEPNRLRSELATQEWEADEDARWVIGGAAGGRNPLTS